MYVRKFIDICAPTVHMEMNYDAESSIVPCAINFQHHPLNLFIFKFNDALLFVECVVGWVYCV
jgi:hypothetical protein